MLSEGLKALDYGRHLAKHCQTLEVQKVVQANEDGPNFLDMGEWGDGTPCFLSTLAPPRHTLNYPIDGGPLGQTFDYRQVSDPKKMGARLEGKSDMNGRRRLQKGFRPIPGDRGPQDKRSM